MDHKPFMKGSVQFLNAEGKVVNPGVWDGGIEPGSLVNMPLLDGDNFIKPHLHQLNFPAVTLSVEAKHPGLSHSNTSANASTKLNDHASDENQEHSDSIGTEISHSGERKAEVGNTMVHTQYLHFRSFVPFGTLYQWL